MSTNSSGTRSGEADESDRSGLSEFAGGLRGDQTSCGELYSLFVLSKQG